MDENTNQVVGNNNLQNINSPPAPRNIREDKTYSNALSQQKFASKTQAIIFPTVTESSLEDYLLALGPLVGPKNIKYCSRISNNRMCIYLSDKETVDKFLNEHGSIIVNNERLQARRLVTPAERLVISNVSPTIPHNLIEFSLRNLGIQLQSPISFLRIGISNPEYNHILSFRRQVYIQPLEGKTLPDSLLITHDDTSYRIFLSQDSQSCYKCKQTGHIASRCQVNNSSTPNQPNPSQNADTNLDNLMEVTDLISGLTAQTSLSQAAPPPTTQHSEKQSPIENASELSVQTTVQENPAQYTKKQLAVVSNSESPIVTVTMPAKRTCSAIISPTSPENQSPIEDGFRGFAKPTSNLHKKYKGTEASNNTTPETLNTSEMTADDYDYAARKFIEEQSPPFVLTFNQLTDFLENVSGSPDALGIAMDYTKDIPALLDMITRLRPYLSKSMKTKCTKLKKKILKQLKITETSILSETESETSQESHC